LSLKNPKFVLSRTQGSILGSGEDTKDKEEEETEGFYFEGIWKRTHSTDFYSFPYEFTL